jgi:hypothetical protein
MFGLSPSAFRPDPVYRIALAAFLTLESVAVGALGLNYDFTISFAQKTWVRCPIPYV